MQACYFYSHVILLEFMYWLVLFPHFILTVKVRIIFKSLNEVCKQTTLRNVKLDNGRRENTALDAQTPF